MELEQRVKVLEQEVKILKNQVQTTLLDIQEQLLVSKYPALRTEDDSATSSLPAQTWTPPALAEANPPIIHTVTLADTPVSDKPDVDIAPIDTEAPPLSGGSAWDDLARLNDWAAATVDRVGLERAQLLIMMYARRGLLTAEVEEALLEAVEVYVGHIATPDPASQAPSQPEDVSVDPVEAEDGSRSERNLILRLIKGLQNGGGARGDLWTRR